MPNNLKYLRGAFIAYEPDGYPDQKRTIPFRFNPESLSRQFTIEEGDKQEGAGGASGGGADGGGEQSADASAGTLKESFSLMLRFDAYDRGQAANGLPPELGIAPEVAALEELMHPSASESEANSDGSEPVESRQRRPTVLFVWGRKRVYPVKITGMKVDETLFNSQLNPMRAEVEVSLDVLGEAEVKDNLAVESALEFTAGNRREMAQMFLDATAEQGTDILPI